MYIKSLPLFRRYLEQREIPFDDCLGSAPTPVDEAPAEATQRARRGRYKGNAIGNAQNLLVRNILSSLGDEQFNAADWEEIVADFGNRCAYCGAEGELVMDHIVPINKQALGEHRLGNLAPACGSCNEKKAAQNFREFLASDPARIAAIDAHMAKHGYMPMTDDEKLRQIIELAHQEVGQLAERYIAIINTVLRDDDEG